MALTDAQRKKLETEIKRCEATAATYKKIADREYAYFKNADANGESEAKKWKHKQSADMAYERVRVCLEKAEKNRAILRENS